MKRSGPQRPPQAYFHTKQASTQRSLEEFLGSKKPFWPARFSWNDRKSSSWSFFCPLCCASRKLGYQAKPAFRHFVQIGLTAAVFMLLTWRWFEWKGIVAFVPMWTAFEIAYRTRVRAEVNCPHCGFDPYLYLVDIQRAREEVETHWRKKYAEKGIPFPEKDRPQALGRKVSGKPADGEPQVGENAKNMETSNSPFQSLDR